MKRLGLYVLILIAGIILGYYLVPAKEKVVIKYKDKIKYETQVVTKTEYKDGKVVTVTQTDIKEVEKIKEVDKLKIIKNKHQVAVHADVNLDGINSINAMYYTPFILGFDIGVGVRYCLDNNYNVTIKNNNTILEDGNGFDRFGILVGLKYGF